MTERDRRRLLGWIFVVVGILPLIAMLIYHQLVIMSIDDAEARGWAGTSMVLLALFWSVPGLLLVLSGLWLIRRSRPRPG